MLLDERTDDLVDAFASALRAKLMRSQLKREIAGTGPADWLNLGDDPAWPAKELRQHVVKGDPLDVAALAAFCWYHGIRTNSGGGA